MLVCLALFGVNNSADSKDLKCSSFATDSTEIKSNSNSITVIQEGKGNSVSVSQSGSTAKTKAIVTSSGEMNTTEIISGSDILETNAMFRGKSNMLVTQSESGMQFLSIKALPMFSKRKNFNFTDFYFIFHPPKRPVYIFQTPGGVIINQ